jgi:hypothetical protein
MVGWGFADKGPDYERLTDASAPGPASNALSASGPKRNRILLLLALGQIALLAFGCYGIVVLVELKLGRIVRSSRISPEVIRQAGWARRPLLPAQPGHVEPAETHPPQLILHEFPTEQSPATSTDNLHLLILTPLRNAERVLPTYFSVVSSLQHPKANTSFGFLIGDEDDNSSSLLYDWAGANAGHYRRISLLRKDFRMDIPSGDERHLAFKQDQRRSASPFGKCRPLTDAPKIGPSWLAPAPSSSLPRSSRPSTGSSGSTRTLLTFPRPSFPTSCRTAMRACSIPRRAHR